MTDPAGGAVTDPVGEPVGGPVDGVDPVPAVFESDPGQRGRLTIRPRAVERIAEMAAGAVPGSVGAVGADAGRMFGRSLPRAAATLTDGSVSLRVGVAASWPSPVADLLTSIRAAVTSDTVRLTGLDVLGVDVQLLRMTDPVDGRAAVLPATATSEPATTEFGTPGVGTSAAPTDPPETSPLPPARARAGVAPVVVVGMLTAVALGGLGVVAIRDGVLGAGLVTGRPWIPAAVDRIDGLHRRAGLLPAVAVAAVALGLLLLVAACRRRPTDTFRLAGTTAITLRSRDVVRLVLAALVGVPGVDDVSASASRRSVRIRVRSGDSTPDTEDLLRRRIAGAVAPLLAVLEPAPAVRVAVQRAEQPRAAPAATAADEVL